MNAESAATRAHQTRRLASQAFDGIKSVLTLRTPARYIDTDTSPRLTRRATLTTALALALGPTLFARKALAEEQKPIDQESFKADQTQFIRPNGQSEMTPERMEKSQQFMKDVLGTMDQVSPALKEYADLFRSRESQHKYEVRGGQFVTHYVFLLDSHPGMSPFIGVRGVINNSPNLLLGVALGESRIAGPDNTDPSKFSAKSTGAIFGLVFEESFNTRMAQKAGTWITHPDPSRKRTAAQIKEQMDQDPNNPDIIESLVFALEKTMTAYESSMGSFEKANITESDYPKEWYVQWKPISDMPDGPQKKQALDNLVKHIFNK